MDAQAVNEGDLSYRFRCHLCHQRHSRTDIWLEGFPIFSSLSNNGHLRHGMSYALGLKRSKPLHQELLMNKWLVIICFNFASATPLLLSPVHGHDGPLDEYGCHLDRDQKYYHCHDGVYKRLSFDSKTQMIQRLKNQYIALGRVWPYREATNDYEQQMPITETTLEPQSVPEGELKQTSPTKRTQSSQLMPRSTSAKQTSKTGRHAAAASPKTEASETRDSAQPVSEARQGSAQSRKRTEPELTVWITKIRADGRPIFESREGERFVLDDQGNKVLVGRNES
jgi:hypothetical protein